MSVDSIRVCHALRRSSEMAFISSSPIVMVLSAKGSSSISLGILRSVRWTRVSGLGRCCFFTHEGCSFGLLFVGRSRTGHSIRLWLDVLHGCIELICVLLPVYLLQVESTLERYGLHGDICIHLHSNGSMLEAWYWFHRNRVAALGNSVGSKDDVRVVPSSPSTAVERAGKLGVVNQAQSRLATRLRPTCDRKMGQS